MGAYEFFRVTIVGVKRKGGGEIELTWTSGSGDRYTVWSSLDLLTGAWEKGETIPSAGISTSWIDLDAVCRQRFYTIQSE